MAIWSFLPREILERVVKKLHYKELLQFGSVCKHWRVLYMENRQRLPEDLPISRIFQLRHFGVPFLLQACKLNSDSRETISVLNEKSQGKVFLPANKWICGSSWGWLVLVDIKGQEIFLLKMFRRPCILKLPSLSTFPTVLNLLSQPDDASRHCFHYIYKAIISTDPLSNPKDCVVMAIVGNVKRLSFWKFGDDEWTNVKGSPGSIEDVTFYQGRFYVVTEEGLTISYDGKNPNDHDKTEVVTSGLWSCEIHMKRYLVPFGEDLLQIWRIYESHYETYGGDEDEKDITLSFKPNQTVKFRVWKLGKMNSPVICTYKLEKEFRGSTNMKYSWSKIETLSHDRLMFIGYNGSFSLPSSIYPNCRIGTRIYFSDDYSEEHYDNLLVQSNSSGPILHDIGVYDMKNNSIHNYQVNDPNDIMPAIWIVNNPWS